VDAGRPSAEDGGVEGLSEVLAVADELYGLVPEAFTAARDEQVRALRRGGRLARALAVKDLRRPSVSAWLVNALVRHRRDEVEQLLQVGACLRDAQDRLEPGELRDLNRQRQAVLSAMVAQARTLAKDLGRPVTDPVLHEVEETLRAALADADAASAVRAGRLTAALAYAGFGEPGSAESARSAGSAGPTARARSVVRSTVTAAVPVATGPSAEEVAAAPRELRAPSAAVREATIAVRAAEDAARRTEGAALVAEQQRDGLAERTRIARERLEAAHAQVAELESLLTAARAAASTAAAAWAPVHAEAEAAAVRADTARGIAESSRLMLRSAREHLGQVERRSR